ncbi:hypothetical protein L1049_004500 [Liquidambar formosana]|uniref:Uncharacterized protein n=1 Tax=Liquidambar formosana TaxID=63359 RepID=A0AAP0RSM6_LIQFO
MAVEAVVSVLVEKLAALLIEEGKFLDEVRDQVDWIRAELQGMTCFLRDADDKQEGDARVKNWIAEIRDASYDVEDIVDTLILRKEQKKNENTIKRYMSIFGDLKFRYEAIDDIGRIRTKLREISERRSTYGIKNLAVTGEASSYAVKRLRERRRSSPHFDESDVIGVEDDLETLKSRLVDDDLENDLKRRVVSIVGMGGLGKTTLAKKVYNSKEVTDRFQCRLWIYVSQSYSAKGLLDEIGKKVMKKLEDDLTLGQMEERLSFYLEMERYLIVMDDVWDVDAWNSVKAAFPDSRNGSRVLLTTRNREVALQADLRSGPHEPKLLSNENSWVLFLKKVGIDQNECPPCLEELGKQIVKKCGGLPLAIVLLGGLLSRKEASYSAWSRLLERVSWQLEQDETPCSKILALSYIDLPHYLKPCFIYFGLFPEDYEIYTRRLIALWIAEGLVQHRDNEPLEDVAEDYIDELIDRSMIQVARRRLDDKIKTCRMHDLLRDLALKKAKEANFLHVSENVGSTLTYELKIRRYAARKNFDICPSSIYCLRSYLFFGSKRQYVSGNPVWKFLDSGIQNKGFGLLRVLDLEDLFKPVLPEALGQLIHLRYIGLRRTGSGSLPPSLGNLRNLQTLDVKYTQITVSDRPIWQLQQLRHLYINGDIRSKIMHPPVSHSCRCGSLSLKNLRTLSGVFIDAETPVKGGLDNSVHLRELKACGDLASQGESLSDWLVKLDGLRVLKLEASAGEGKSLPKMMRFSSNRHLYRLDLYGRFPEKLFDVHKFPPNLIILTLFGCELEEDPFPTLEKLQNLKTLKLLSKSCIRKEFVCSSGGFQRLQVLKLAGLHELENWKVEEGAMRGLKMLEFSNCKRLKMVPDGLRHITTLQELKVFGMLERFTTRIQRSDGVDRYKIMHIPSIDIKGRSFP